MRSMRLSEERRRAATMERPMKGERPKATVTVLGLGLGLDSIRERGEREREREADGTNNDRDFGLKKRKMGRGAHPMRSGAPRVQNNGFDRWVRGDEGIRSRFEATRSRLGGAPPAIR